MRKTISAVCLGLPMLLLLGCSQARQPQPAQATVAAVATEPLLAVASPTGEPAAVPSATSTALPIDTPAATGEPEDTATSRAVSPSPTSAEPVFPSSTATATPSPAAAGEATQAPTPLPTLVAEPTAPLPPTETLVDACMVLSEGNFLVIWRSDEELQAALGCPASYHPRVVPAAWEVETSYQPFEHGEMIWSDHIGWYGQKVVFVLFSHLTYRMVNDTFDPALDSLSGGETPPSGLLELRLGFGKVWRQEATVRQALGWATAPETAGKGRFQSYARGYMVWITQTNATYVFRTDVGLYEVSQVPFR